MTRILLLVAVFALFAVAPASAQQSAPPSPDHSAHHPEPAAPPTASAPTTATQGMSSAARLDELVKKMNDATGPAKTAAMAELLTALVKQQHSCESMMANMMKTMHGENGHPSMPSPAK